MSKSKTAGKLTIGALAKMLQDQIDRGVPEDTEVVWGNEAGTQVQTCTIGWMPCPSGHVASIIPMKRGMRTIKKGGGPDCLPDSIL